MAIAVCLSGSSRADTPKLRNTVVIPLTLPAKFQSHTVPQQALDDELRVGLVLPRFNAAKSAGWNVAANLKGSNLFALTYTEFDHVVVNFADPIAAALPKELARVFPRIEVVSNRECSKCDLVISVELESRTLDDGRGRLVGLSLTMIISGWGKDGKLLTTFSVEGTGPATKPIYWSERTKAEGMGIPALQQAIDLVIKKLVQDATLTALLKEKAVEHAEPSNLETVVAFDDADSFSPNRRLDAGERARLRFTVQNRGTGTAFAARLRMTIATKGVTVPVETVIGDIAAGEKRELDLPISAGLDLEVGQPELRIETLEKRGFGGRPVLLQIATNRLQRPTIEIADVSLSDRGGQASGDRDGRPANGETLEAVILVRNSGPGDAAGAALTVSASPGIEIVQPSIAVEPMAVNAIREVRTLIRIPVTFDKPELLLRLRAVETRGPSVAAVETAQRWPLVTKRPQIEVSYRLYDGNSPQSRGNRDGVANNGETLEIALVPVNHGALAARSVRLALVSTVKGIDIQPSVLDIGDLPPLTEGTERRVQLIVSRALGRDDLLHTIPLTITIANADFAAGDQVLSLPFKSQRPELVASIGTLPPLLEGTPAVFTLDVRNQGALTAEDVRVDVSSDNPAVELLDADGTPSPRVRVDIGKISPQSGAGRIQLRARIRRNVDAIAGMLKAAVSQRDFGAVATQAALTIAKEAAQLISAVPPPVNVVTTRGLAAAATISFQRFRDGSRVSDATVGFPFEVQAQTPLQTVRLEQNHRTIELPIASATRTNGGYLWQYEPQVQLDYGANDFEVVVITAEGVRNSRAMTLHREKPRGKIWLAVVGISHYREPSVPALQFAKDDAVAVEAYYRQAGVPPDQTITLLDEQATLANIKRRLGTDLVKNASNPDDMVIVYFAGHGQMEADRSSPDSDGYSKYLLPHDVNPNDLFGSALSMEELSRILQRLRPERVVLIIDSCFSGAAGGRTPYEPSSSSRSVVSEEFLWKIAEAGKGRVILTASGSREVAQEWTQTRHGVFTFYLLEGLRGAADGDRDGRIDIDEIYKYVSQKVSSATHGRQNPTRKSPNLTGTLVVGGNLQ